MQKWGIALAEQIVRLPLHPPDPVVLPILNRTPFLWLVASWLRQGVLCAGGFPLWLAGGASSYNDIDLYCPTLYEYYPTLRELAQMGPVEHQTPLATVFRVCGEYIQLTRPVAHLKTRRDLMECSDLSPDACALVDLGGHLAVEALYPDDIAQRVCWVLIEHEWTSFRKEIYEKKGYHVSTG